MIFIFDKMNRKTFVVDVYNHSYKIIVDKTLIVDYIPHQSPALLGTVEWCSLNNDDYKSLSFDFTAEKLYNDVNIELKPNFDTSIIFISDFITDPIKESIKSYYGDLLNSNFYFD